MVEAALEAAEELAGSGIHATVWDVRVVRPPDHKMLADATAHQLVVTVEDGLRTGGAGAFLADCLARGSGAEASELDGWQPGAPPVLVLGLPARYIPHGRPADILSSLGLDGPGIAESVARALKAAPAPLELD